MYVCGRVQVSVCMRWSGDTGEGVHAGVIGALSFIMYRHTSTTIQYFTPG